jgi:hypothetical protein
VSPPSYSGCASGYLCVYHDAGGTGPMASFDHDDADLSQAPTGILNHHGYSAWNKSGSTFCIYYDAGYGGASTTIPPGARGDLGADFAANVSSLRIVQGSGC